MPSRRAVIAALALAPLPLRAAELTAHDFGFPGIDGGYVRLADFAGKAVLVVNTASRCGYTPQYEGLQALWDEYRDAGLVVLGVPSGDFNQELASEAEVKEFCQVNFAIDFPMTAISPVTGTGAAPFYAWAARALGPENAPRWNFHKYLVGPDGRLVAAFPTRVAPDAAEIREAIETTLAGRKGTG